VPSLLAMAISAALVVASSTSGDPLLDWLSRAGAVGVLAFVVLAFMRGWVVSGDECNKVRAERDRALDLVYEQAKLARTAIEAGEKKGQS
jgi:hypothetical protein